MKNAIFYFTGTGNSLSLAKKLAQRIGDTELISIAKVVNEKDIGLNYDSIGFVFPVYYYLPPNIVKKFISMLKFNSKQYIFAVATCGGMAGISLKDLSERIEKSGGKLSAAYSLMMPGNYIVKYGAFPDIFRNFLSKREKTRVKIISDNVSKRKIKSIPKGDLLSKKFTGYAYKMSEEFNKMSVNFSENGSCNGCGICTRICPTNNIDLSDKKPVWGNKCEHCMACIQWCAKKAIEYRNVTQNRKRYTNREIDVKDILIR